MNELLKSAFRISEEGGAGAVRKFYLELSQEERKRLSDEAANIMGIASRTLEHLTAVIIPLLGVAAEAADTLAEIEARFTKKDGQKNDRDASVDQKEKAA